MIRTEEVYKIGKFNKPHGVKGELQFTFTDDVFDRVDADYLICRMDGILVPFFLEEYRFRSDSAALVKLEDVDTLEKAARFTNIEVYFPKALVEESDEEPSAWDYFIDFKVEDAQAGFLGVVKEVDQTTLNVLFVIESEHDEILIPAHEAFIEAVDPEKRILRLNLPEGMITINE